MILPISQHSSRCQPFHCLLGPPETRRPPSPVSIGTPNGAAGSGDPFLHLMDSSFNSPPPRPPMTLTENNSPTFSTSGNPCLDFFFQVVPNTPAATVTALLAAAWRHRPTTALKLVCHLRGVRGTGKNDKEGFYSSALWLHQHHPRTLALNTPSIAAFGYIKDLPEILYRLIDGPDAREKRKQEMDRRAPRRLRLHAKKQRKDGTGEQRLAAEAARAKLEVEQAAILRRQKRKDLAARAVGRYRDDTGYRFLHDKISDFFAAALTADLEAVSQGKFGISLAAKWCPSLDSSFDRYSLLCESIARRIFPRESSREYTGIKEEHYAYRVRDRLRKEVLVPLRKVLQLPEIYMSFNQWGLLPYERVASVAMSNYKHFFAKRDGQRFAKFLCEVKKGEAKIAAGALLPHEIVAEVRHGDDEVAELQWERMVSDLLETGKLKNCIAVCDVSGSMHGIPMNVCVALGLLISELSEAPWKGRVITFSDRPRMHLVKGETLREKISFVENTQWNMNTDFQKVFDQILRVAVKGKLEPEKMIRTIFVFSDMEFDEASTSRHWETDYEVICRKFREKGYGSSIPQIVFWNLRDSRSTPVSSAQEGVALVSGFSKNMVKPFLDGEVDLSRYMNPELVMEAAISHKDYDKLVVYD